MNPLRALLPAKSETRWNDYDLTWMTTSGGGRFPLLFQTAPGSEGMPVGDQFTELVDRAYRRGGVVGAVMQARIMALSQIRFLHQDVDDGRPGAFHDHPSLDLVRRPWPGGTTQNLLAAWEAHNSLAGNGFATVRGNRIKVMRPDWVTFVFMSADEVDNPLDMDLVGYLYWEGGKHSGNDPVALLANEVAHYAPLPDPVHPWRGMSWITTVLRQVGAHQAAADHKSKFFSNGATPNMVIKFDPTVAVEDLKAFEQLFLAKHAGVKNAYRTAFLGGGGDPTVVGMNFQQLDFKQLQGADETLIAAAAGVPPIIANLSEGIAAATYSNYGQAKRHFADTTISYLAGEASASLEVILPTPRGRRLWYDIRDIPFFRDDAKSEAEVQQIEAAMIRSLIDGGWEADSVLAAIKAQGDWSLLVHTGKLSVQLQEPGSQPDETNAAVLPFPVSPRARESAYR